ncbi:hypothetical protein EWM62_03385 [Mucilaginibacter terrigena]|uniref:Uncharacterized protein n=1 Tax=Mucilaginibacter terrigena TaxID=2492395 RepID=A0A4V1ZCF6_9SPHI|nr:hypothetical protein [Mucilaginibacter terrigena]RYU92490.1 hypothetical protein EWM62_03385 [Mucilaginibacter terrigena]
MLVILGEMHFALIDQKHYIRIKNLYMRYIYAFILLLGYHCSVAQQQINGVGDLQLGKTESEILAVLKLSPEQIIDGSSKTVKYLEKNKENKVLKFKYDPLSPLVKDIISSKLDINKTLDNLFIKKCKDAVVYLIPTYEVYGTTFNSFALTFYKGTLIKILANDEAGKNALFMVVFKSKYGEGKVGRPFYIGLDACAKPMESVTTTWDAGQDIAVLASHKNYCVVKSNYDEKTIDENRFVIQNNLLFDELLKCNSAGSN